jgi:predicted ArsR family transcriptional regulator
MVDDSEAATAAVSPTSCHASDEDSTRERVLATILAASPISASELATALNLTAAAVRRHLEWLESAGKITTRAIRTRGVRGRGRPAKAYVVTDSGRGDFHHEYDRMALLAIDELVATSGPAGMDRLAAQFFAPIVSGTQATVAAADMRQVVSLMGERPAVDPATVQRCAQDGEKGQAEASATAGRGQARAFSPVQTAQTGASSLVNVLNSCGYVASLTSLPSGSQLIQHQCPVADVARAHPQLCEIETQIFGQLLHSHVQRLATIAHGDPACTTHIPIPVIKTQRGLGTNQPQREVDIA